MTKPHLIDQILKDLSPLNTTAKYKSKTANTPAPSTVTLKRDPDGQPHDDQWSYHLSVIGKLNFLEKSSHPNLAYAVHNCARFSTDPKICHSQAVKRIGCYLLGTKDQSLIMTPNPRKSIKSLKRRRF
jgi:hypothetical protein